LPAPAARARPALLRRGEVEGARVVGLADVCRVADLEEEAADVAVHAVVGVVPGKVVEEPRGELRLFGVAALGCETGPVRQRFDEAAAQRDALVLRVQLPRPAEPEADELEALGLAARV